MSVLRRQAAACRHASRPAWRLPPPHRSNPARLASKAERTAADATDWLRRSDRLALADLLFHQETMGHRAGPRLEILAERREAAPLCRVLPRRAPRRDRAGEAARCFLLTRNDRHTKFLDARRGGTVPQRGSPSLSYLRDDHKDTQITGHPSPRVEAGREVEKQPIAFTSSSFEQGRSQYGRYTGRSGRLRGHDRGPARRLGARHAVPLTRVAYHYYYWKAPRCPRCRVPPRGTRGTRRRRLREWTA